MTSNHLNVGIEEPPVASGSRTLVSTLPLRPLPRPLTALIGREQEVVDGLDLLRQAELRLLTLTGPGGVGKTRLALELARAFQQETGIDAAFVNLAPVTDPALVPTAVAAAIGMNAGDSATLMNRLVQTLAGNPLLLVLDNFEQAISANVLVSLLLSECPELKILVTSRMPLRIQGEQEMNVAPFVSPDPFSYRDRERIAANDAVRLFVHRAQASRRDFALTNRNAQVVAEICSRLDGLPLAIELAAARIKVFSTTALLDRLSDRMALLTDGPRDLPSRLQTMRDAIQWSYDLLAPTEQAIFRRLAIFSGSFAWSAAVAVAGPPLEADPDGRTSDARAVLDGISSLIDKSLITRSERDDDESRFRMLETIREFGLHRLRDAGEDREIRLRFLRYFAEMAKDAIPALIGPEQAQWMQQLDDEVANFRLALQVAIDHWEDGGQDGLQIASALWRYWLVRGQLTEGTLWLERVLSLPVPFPAALQAAAMNNLGNLYLELGQLGRAREQYIKSRDLYASVDDAYGIADELNNLGLVELIRGDFVEARRILEESLALRRTYPDRLALPATLCNLGDIATFEEDYETAERYHAEAYEIRVEVGNKRGLALSCHSLGLIAFYRGDLDGAQRRFDEGMIYAKEVTDAYGRAILQVDSGLVATARRQLIPALELTTAALRTLRQMGSRRMMAEALDGMAAAATLANRSELAVRLLGGSQRLRELHTIAITTRSHKDFENLRSQLVRRLGAEAFHLHFEAGRVASSDAIFDEALHLLDDVRQNGASSSPVDAPQSVAGLVDEEALERLGLTGREREILALLVHGFSDKEIADRLYISPRTAMTHVANVLGKLDVNKRAAAASIALRDHLVDPAAPLPRR